MIPSVSERITGDARVHPWQTRIAEHGRRAAGSARRAPVREMLANLLMLNAFV